MFTGIIEHLGTVRRIAPANGGTRLTLSAPEWDELRLGESIAVNGACLTVAAIGGGEWLADLSPETLRRTTLGRLRVGDDVHLERSLRLSDRLGGHIVQGHVDEVGVIERMTPAGNSLLMDVVVSERNRRYLAEKGSIGVHGVSLTIAELMATGFRVALIPFTLAKTTIPGWKIGDSVNLEFDVLMKYVERLLSFGDVSTGQKRLNISFLKENGYIA